MNTAGRVTYGPTVEYERLGGRSVSERLRLVQPMSNMEIRIDAVEGLAA